MRKTLIGVASIVAGLALFATPAFAAPETLNWGSQVNPQGNTANCVKVGAPVVNINEKVLNDVDSGQAGNYWAFDNLTRQIQVWNSTTTGQYCVVVRYQGNFSAVAGQTSPGGSNTLSGTESGPFEGGYNGTLTGSLLSTPLWTTKGSVGTVDYQCDILGNCPGYVDWTTQYFSAPALNLDFWGWIYHGGNNGTWVNASTGTSGDIL